MGSFLRRLFLHLLDWFRHFFFDVFEAFFDLFVFRRFFVTFLPRLALFHVEFLVLGSFTLAGSIFDCSVEEFSWKLSLTFRFVGHGSCRRGHCLVRGTTAVLVVVSPLSGKLGRSFLGSRGDFIGQKFFLSNLFSLTFCFFSEDFISLYFLPFSLFFFF